MTTGTPARPATAPPAPGATGAEPRARFRDLVAAEWIKLWSLRSTPWSLLITALAVVGFNAGTAWDHYRYLPRYDAESRAAFVRDELALSDAFTTNAAMVLMLAVGAVGAVAVTGEYGTRSIRATFAAVPARGSVMAAKAVVVTAVTTALGAIVAVTSFFTTQAILSGRDAGLPIDHPGAGRVVVASALLAPVSALAGMAVGVLVRHGAATVVATVAILVLLPAVFTEDRRWSAVADHATPAGAWHRLTELPWFDPPFPWTTTGAWTVYAVWALAAAAITVTGARHRDQ
jgi:hypothetical protein